MRTLRQLPDTYLSFPKAIPDPSPTYLAENMNWFTLRAVGNWRAFNLCMRLGGG
jgi:hypothetical protein